MTILDCLDHNDLIGARDLLLADIKEQTKSLNSWDSPQYTTSKIVQEHIKLDYSRDALFTYFGLEVIKDRYFLRNKDQIVEDCQKFWARIATGVAYAGLKSVIKPGGIQLINQGVYEVHDVDPSGKPVLFQDIVTYAQELYEILSKHWFTLATPVLTNIGSSRGLPISCFLNTVSDSIEGIYESYSENAFLSKGGGGIGAHWGNVRHQNARLGTGGKSSGIVPFLKVMDASTLAVSQGNTRRGAAAVYLNVWHPEIEEFIEIRKPTGGDLDRRCLNLHHGIVVDDAFMVAVENRTSYALRCPKTNEVVKEIDAFELFRNIMKVRIETGEPYILFIDAVLKDTPVHHVEKKLFCQQSNLCSEITLPTTVDRTAVCCLGSLNLENYDQWKDDPNIIYTAVRALDNVLQDFIYKADAQQYKKSIFSATQERSVGLGVMGYHGMLMQKGIPFESIGARSLNRLVFKNIHTKAKAASVRLGQERGVCPDGLGTVFNQRNSYVLSIAPTANISVIAGNSTPGIEPIVGQCYLQKTLSGSFLVKNKYLEQYLESINKNTAETWKDIIAHGGSILHLPYMDDKAKAVFKTAFEINQRELAHQAGDRQPFICQAQSLNLFFDVPVSMKYLYDVHMEAWKSGCKSLYYLRSQPILKADSTEREAVRKQIENTECAVCQ